MNNSLPLDFFWDNSLQLGHETMGITNLLWPNYILGKSDIPDTQIEFELDVDEFVKRCPNWGIRNKTTNELVSYISAIQLNVDLSLNSLPDEGWSFAAEALSQKEEPNCLCLLVANTKPEFARLGFSQLLIDKVKVETQSMGFNTLIAPVRPTFKNQFPELSMEEYLSMKNEKNEIFDPWIRQHLRSGSSLVNICSRSVVVKATLSKWHQWLGIHFQTSGLHIIPKGLVPLNVDIENNIGTYIEPNVWVKYDFK